MVVQRRAVGKLREGPRIMGLIVGKLVFLSLSLQQWEQSTVLAVN
jgi:hypothetical protein